jgi:putative thioredoxin
MIINVTDSDFEAQVVEKSNEVPVVVDFWADWCQPCRVLGPVLENLAKECEGRFVLAKANTEQAPRSAAKFRVQSIPAVYGLRDGRVVDGFLGAMPERQIRDWLNRFLPSEAELLVARARSIMATCPEEAEVHFRRAAELDPRLAAAPIGLAQLLMDRSREDECRQIIAELESRGFLEPEAERIKAALELKQIGAQSADVAECRTRLAKDPTNTQLQLDLVRALAATSNFTEALPLALSVVHNDRGDLREQARQMMVDIFRLLPADSPDVAEYRRKLSLALY